MFRFDEKNVHFYNYKQMDRPLPIGQGGGLFTNHAVHLSMDLALNLLGDNSQIHLTSELNFKTLPVLPSLIFPFHLLPSLVHPTGFPFYIFRASLPFLSCCHRTTLDSSTLSSCSIRRRNKPILHVN